MDLLDILIYKKDNITGMKRVSKTKLITLIVFLVFFIISISMYLTNPEFQNNNIIVILLASIIFALIFAVPTFIIGFLIGKFIIKDNSNATVNNNQNYNQTNNNQNYNQTNNNQNFSQNNNRKEYNKINKDNPTSNDFVRNNPCPHSFAKEFKEAIDENDEDAAKNILLKWDSNDANHKYASIIYEGMPPTDITLSQLNEWLQQADNMEACDKSLREWFKSTALEVISLHG